MSGHIAVEAQLTSAAQRHLQLHAGDVQLCRGDGWALFSYGALSEENQIGSEVQSLLSAVVRDVTSSRVSSVVLRGEEKESHFGKVSDRSVSFCDLLVKTGAMGKDDVAHLTSLPDTPGVASMLQLLYQNVVGDMKLGLTAVTDFPRLLCATGSRFDVILQGLVCVKAYSHTTDDITPNCSADAKADMDVTGDRFDLETSLLKNSYSAVKLPDGGAAKVWIDTRSLAQALALQSGAAVEAELPAAWRSKSFNLMEASEVLSMVHTSLKQFWAQSRVTQAERAKVNALSLLSIVSGDLREYLRSQVELYSADWRAPWRMQLPDLRLAVALCRQWNTIVGHLISNEWVGWEGGMFHDESLDATSSRLLDVLRVRETVANINTLGEKVPSGMQPEILFDGMNAMDVRTVTPSRWAACVAAFDKEVSFLEPNLRNRAKQLLQSPPSDSTLRKLAEFKTLLRRPAIEEAVAADLDRTADYLVQQLKQIVSRFENNLRRCTTPLQRLRAIRGCHAECVMIPEWAARVFGSTSERTAKVKAETISATEGVCSEEGSVASEWMAHLETDAKKVMEVQEALVVSRVTSSGKSVHRAQEGILTCAIHPMVRQFLQDVRHYKAWLTESELADGKSKRSATDKGEKHVSMWKVSDSTDGAMHASERFFMAALKTQKCVGNNNTALAQILPCTRRMLAPAVERCVSQVLIDGAAKRTVSVANYAELDGLNMRFQNSIEALSTENRHVRRFHQEFSNQVVALLTVDLTKHMDQWRSAVDGMRSGFEEFLLQRHLSDYDDWRRYWDAQIYKALEYQYRKGLESLHEEMEEFKVELVLKQGQVQYKPSFEAIREAYYVKLREFVSVPLRFRGLQPKRADANASYELYPQMPLTNNNHVMSVHTKAIELFAKLNRVRKAFRLHIVVGLCGASGAPDLDAIVDEFTAQNQEKFTEGLRTVEEHRQKLEKIQDVMKVDCFSISTVPVKVSIEEHLHRLEESLLNSMRRNIQASLNEVDEFIHRASNVVERQPTTMDEVGQSNKAYHEYLGQLSDYNAKLDAIMEQNKELRNHFGASLELGATRARWDHLREAMASHEKVMASSVNKMRDSLESLIQRFVVDVNRFGEVWKRQKDQLMKAFTEKKTALVQKLLISLKDQLNDIADLKTQAKELKSKCEYFNHPVPTLKSLATIDADVEQTSSMWGLYDQFEQELNALREEDWLTFRAHIYQFEDFCASWRKTVAKRRSSKAADGQDGAAAKGDAISTYLNNLLKEWGDIGPALKCVRGDGWMAEHWNEMFRLIDIPKGTTSTSLTFGMILDHYDKLLEKQSELKHLQARAQGEIQLREALQDLRTWGLEAAFTLTTPSDSASKVKLITEWKEVMTQVSDNQALVNSLKDSPFFVHFADEATGWESKLVSLSQSLGLLNNIQRRWAYLEPIFARGALPQEQARFKRVDREFVSILREIEADPRIMSLASQADVNEKLQGILEQIERCQKSLMEYLEAKRDKLPRFYFISDEDLLEILGHSQNPSVIQTHLKKLFMGIHSVEFNSGQTSITHIYSADREKVSLIKPVPITSNDVEDWLLELDDSMRSTLHDLLVSCSAVADPTTVESIAKYPSQILQVAQGIQFARQVEEAIKSQHLKDLLQSLSTRLDRLTSVTSGMSDVDLLKAKALILDTIHNREVVELLLAKSVRKVEEWWWQKQLRYYLSAGDNKCTVRMVDTVFDYTYEYQGNAAKLVHTPLTDKCYLVLTKGMGLGYGGNPYGPAGTGKTESVKALGSAMGRQVLVFNCDEGIDFKSMGRIFVGIVKCGAWGCFDEFNRLKIDQLSAISQMIQVIQQALKGKEPSCLLLNRDVDVNSNAGIFVTLNPAGKGYGGRTRLPDNLKQLFREVAMSVPDNELITSTMLLSEGFTHARSLAKNIVELYKLCGQLMSRQQHYDWGLRPLKAVLRLGGTLVQRWRREHEGKVPSEAEETELMLQSLNINTLSKLTYDDARLFTGLLHDIFPGVESREVTYGELESAMKTAIAALGLQFIKSQQRKALQLYEAMNQRMGVVLVGPSGSGKSTLLRILRKSLEVMKVDVPMHVVNPKAIPRRQLLGYMDPDTREWYDGVLTAAAREVVKQPKDARPWILCDGDIDPEWIESLNSVLDDNKLLTMPNGVRIQFGNNVNFIFETHSLEFASPATVSRMGVLFFSEKDVHLEAVAESRMSLQSEERKKLLTPLVMKYVFNAIDETIALRAFSVPTTRMGLLRASIQHTLDAQNEADFVYRLIRGLGGALSAEGAAQLAKSLYATSCQKPISDSRPLDTYWNVKHKRAAEFSADLSAKVVPADLLAGRAPMVRTAEVQRLTETLAPLFEDPDCTPVFLVGPEGCGKGALLDHTLSSSNYAAVRVTTINCSAQTNSTHVIQRIEQYCAPAMTNSGVQFRPKDGERLVIVLKNVNLPKADAYGTVELHSFLQQLVLYKGYYNSDLDWVAVDKVQLVSTMNPNPSAGRYPVTTRLLALSSIVTMPYPSKTSLVQIYSTYWASLLQQTTMGQGKDYEKGAELAQLMLHVYEKMRKRFEGEEYAHFALCPRHLTRWMADTLLYKIDAQTTLPAVLAYEANRIFSDCLPRAEDRAKAARIFADQLATIGYAAPAKEDAYATMFVTWFGDAMTASKEEGKEGEGDAPPTEEGGLNSPSARAAARRRGPSHLLEQKKYADVLEEVNSALVRYSREFKDLPLPCIPEMVSWLTRVNRVLARPGGHLVMVGSTGVGRRNAVLLGAYMCRMEVVSLNMTHDYSLKQYRNDMRAFVQRATTQDEQLILLLEDHNIVQETFLEYINSLLSGGDIPGLFSQEEMESMFSAIREDAASEGHMGPIYDYFVKRLRRNLRVALIMDNRHPLFLIRLQSNPALMSHCELLWMGTWSSEVTKTICKDSLKEEVAVMEQNPANKGFHVHREVNAIHESMGAVSTPRDVQDLVETFKAIMKEKSQSSEEKAQRLEVGLAKLKEAEGAVEKVKKDVAEKKEDVVRMQKEADKALNEIQQNMQDSQEQRDEAATLQEKLESEQVSIAENRRKVEEELGSIKPMMEAARDAVSSIRGEQLSEIRSLKAPPEPIRDVLEGVLALLGVTDVSWQSMRQFLGERGAKERILDFNVKNVTPNIRMSVQRLLQQKANSFKAEVIHRASVAAAPMAEWVKAMVEYSSIMERIAPLTEQLEKLERNLKDGESRLHEIQKKLKKIDALVEDLRTGFSKKCKEAERLRAKLKQAEEELAKAQDLLEKLSGEKSRWAKEAATIKEANDSMPRRALIAAAFSIYLGKETEDGRRAHLKAWCARLGFADVFSVAQFMRSESELLKYKTEGLPGDDLSMENSVTILDAIRAPLVLDPASQAVEWVKEHLRVKGTVVESISLHDERFTHTLELAVRFGKTLLVTDVDRIIPLLYPVLRRDLISAGPKRVVQVGNKAVEWQNNFRLIFFSRQAHVSLPPAATALVTEVSFSVTSLGLESQLLGATIRHEKPELEEVKAELLKKEEGLQLEVAKLEERLLKELAESQGNLLDNNQLVESLNDVKTQAAVIAESLAESRRLQAEMEEKREVYRPFAHHGALIFFIVQSLEKLNRMYKFGLADYLRLFTNTLKTYKGTDGAAEKVQSLIHNFTQVCFQHVSRGLLKQDRLIFALHVLRGLWPSEFPEKLWNALIGAVADVKSVADSEMPQWASMASKVKYASIVSSSEGAEIVAKWNLSDLNRWGALMRSASPEKDLASSMTKMEQLLFINTFRPDRLAAASMSMALRKLGLPSLAPIVSLEETILSSRANMPVVFVTASGADPSMELQDIANHLVGKERFTQIALGGGQTEEAMLQLRRCAAQGDWLLLKNLHLVLDWAGQLEKELCSMPEPHRDFRLLITTEPHDLFPGVLLRMSTKLTVESPPGIKQNMLRSYNIWDAAFIEHQTPAGSNMLLGLAWFHAVVQERRTYVPQGWSKYYEFSPADLKTATDVLTSLSKEKEVDWVTVTGLLQSCLYGGRLEKACDEGVLEELVRCTFNPDVLMRDRPPLGPGLSISAAPNHAAVVKMIESQLPDVDPPGMLSLCDNADRTVQEDSARAVTEALRLLAHVGDSESASVEKWRELLVPVVEVWRSSGLSVSGPPRSISTANKDPEPMEVFFVSEVNLLGDLIRDLTSFYDSLRAVAEGTMIPSTDLREEANELIGGRMPSRWLDRMSGPQEAKLWLALLHRKHEMTTTYMKQPLSPSTTYDLSALLRPQTFFNALRQHTARATRSPLVNLEMVASLGGVSHASVTVSILGASLLLQGAAMGGDGRLTAVSSDSPSSAPLPGNVVVAWVPKEKAAASDSVAKIPVYGNAERSEQVLTLRGTCGSRAEVQKVLLAGSACYVLNV